MTSFSERHGYRPNKPVQYEWIDKELRTRLWNVFELVIWSQLEYQRFMPDIVSEQPLQKAMAALWVDHFNRPLSDMPLHWTDLHRTIRIHFFECKWNEALDFVEYVASHSNDLRSGLNSRFESACNAVFERENSAYRLVGTFVTPVSDGTEIREIERALETPFDAVHTQIASALEKLSQRPEPDYRNSIKESIGAVETAVRLASGKENGDFAKLIRELGEKLGLHSALIDGFKKLYGFTSDDASGIRHGMMDKSDLTADDARYMLVTCSAFANYLLTLAMRAGMLQLPK